MGRQSRHRKGVAGRQWAKRAQSTLKVFSPNLQWATIDGMKLKLCTRCLKRLKVPSTSAKPDLATADKQVAQIPQAETKDAVTA